MLSIWVDEAGQIAEQYFTHEVYFTNPERIYFVEKSVLNFSVRFFLEEPNGLDAHKNMFCGAKLPFLFSILFYLFSENDNF